MRSPASCTIRGARCRATSCARIAGAWTVSASTVAGARGPSPRPFAGAKRPGPPCGASATPRGRCGVNDRAATGSRRSSARIARGSPRRRSRRSHRSRGSCGRVPVSAAGSRGRRRRRRPISAQRARSCATEASARSETSRVNGAGRQVSRAASAPRSCSRAGTPRAGAWRADMRRSERPRSRRRGRRRRRARQSGNGARAVARAAVVAGDLGGRARPLAVEAWTPRRSSTPSRTAPCAGRAWRSTLRTTSHCGLRYDLPLDARSAGVLGVATVAS